MKKRRSRLQDDEEPKAVREMRKNKNKKEEKTVEESKRRKRSKKDKKKNRKKIILTAMTIIILILGVALGISGHTWTTIAKDMVTNESSIVIDTNGNTIAKLGDEKKKSNISYEEMPNNLKNAYVAIEDERFYSHHGVDIKRTASAIFNYVIHFGSSSFGGSTITQQLVKNLTGDNTDSVLRKVKEWWKAWLLETSLSKEEILEGYLNIIYVGPSIYGVDAGAKYYFDKSASKLSLEECAFLAGINHSPNSYNPFGDADNSEKIEKRTITVLDKMLELEYITQDEHDEAVSNVKSGLEFDNGDIEAKSDGVYSYHTDALITEITNDIEDKYNISEEFATNYINMAGLTIHSTQDSDIQDETEKECEKSKYVLKSQIGGDSSQAAMVVMDHKTGQVLSCVGALGEKTKARPFNRATQSVRQTGSAIKPIAILAPAIDKKIITASSVYDDKEQDFENGYHPVDYNKALGEITVRRAVESSQNIPFVEIMEELTPKTSIKYLEEMGITSLTKNDEGLPLALGGLDKGISPLQMAGAYSTIANEGIYIEPTFYTQIDRRNGSKALESKQKSKRVFSKEVAYILKSLLTQPVVGENGTATYCKISGVDVAAKTGTTDENYDRWLCGFTPYYTAVTWYGFDQNESIDFNGRNPAGLIWANVMARIHAGLKTAEFEKPSGVLARTICADTGKIATTGCENTYTEYFLWFTVPDTCTRHQGTEITKEPNENNINNNSNEVIKEITNEIDEKEPPRITKPTDSRDTINNNNNNNSNNNENNSENEITNTINTSRPHNTTNTSGEGTNTTNRNETNTSTNTNSNTSSNSNTTIDEETNIDDKKPQNSNETNED